MPWIRFDHFAIETLDRVFGTRAFVAALDAAVPEAHLAAANALKVWADEKGIDAAEYFSERDLFEGAIHLVGPQTGRIFGYRRPEFSSGS